MRYLFIALTVILLAAVAAYVTAKPVRCDDCNQGKKCNTSFDCGEIGVCYCQYTFEEEQGMGTCYFE